MRVRNNKNYGNECVIKMKIKTRKKKKIDEIYKKKQSRVPFQVSLDNIDDYTLKCSTVYFQLIRDQFNFIKEDATKYSSTIELWSQRRPTLESMRRSRRLTSTQCSCCSVRRTNEAADEKLHLIDMTVTHVVIAFVTITQRRPHLYTDRTTRQNRLWVALYGPKTWQAAYLLYFNHETLSGSSWSLRRTSY